MRVSTRASALCLVLLGCGSSEPPPIFPGDPPVLTAREVPTWPWWGYEYLATLSYRPSDPAAAVAAVAAAGGSQLRTLTQLPRWGQNEAPKGWFVDALQDRAEWLERRNAMVRAGKRHGVRIEISLFDEPTRWDRPEVRAALAREGLNPRLAGTWLGREVSEETAIELAAWWLEGLPPHAMLTVRTSNEPQDIPGMPEDALERWLRDQGYTVARTTRFGSDGPYGQPDYLWEHAWGPPGAGWPEAGLERLVFLSTTLAGVVRTPALTGEAEPFVTQGRLERTPTPLAWSEMTPNGTFRTPPRVGLSTDGFGAEDFPLAAEAGCRVLDAGFGYSILLRRAPDLFVPAVRCTEAPHAR